MAGEVFEYPEGYQTNPYCIEYARSSRAMCQGCKTTIDKGDLRMGSPIQLGDRPVSWKWRHFHCLTSTVLNNMRGKVGRHGRDVAIVGLDKLRPKDLSRVERTLGEQGLAAAKEEEEEGEEEEEEEESSESSGEQEGGQEDYVPPAAVKTPKKPAPGKRAPKGRAKKTAAAEESDEDYQPQKRARGGRAKK